MNPSPLGGQRGGAIAALLATAIAVEGAIVGGALAGGGPLGVAAALLGFATLVAVGWVADRRTRATIDSIAETAERIAGGDLGRRAAVATGDPLEALAAAFNRMADRLVEQHAILTGLDAAVILVDPEHRVAWHNATAERWFGRDGRVVPPCHVAARERATPCRGCLAAACLKSGGARATEVVWRAPDGPRHYAISGSPVFAPDGSVTGVLELIQDVTDRRTLEAQLRQAESMARVGELAATIAHEIKNPLAGMRLAIELAARDLPKGSRGEQAVPGVIGLIERLDASVRDLLAFVRPIASARVRCDLRAVIEDALSLVRAHRAVARISVRREEAGAAPEVMADPASLRQVFANLIVNAAEAMQETPPDAAVLTISTSAAGGSAVAELADCGAGIGAQAAANVFRPFFTTKPAGTGLGLAICRRIVEAHAGEVALEPAKGAPGACARVRLPLAGRDSGEEPRALPLPLARCAT